MKKNKHVFVRAPRGLIYIITGKDKPLLTILQETITENSYRIENVFMFWFPVGPDGKIKMNASQRRRIRRKFGLEQRIGDSVLATAIRRFQRKRGG